MQIEPNSPSKLHFIDKAPDDGPFLRLMVLNPFNNEMSTFVNTIIETDPPDYAPSAADLHTVAQARA